MASLYVADGYVSSGYVQTGVTIDWGNKIIFIPKTETTLIQSSPVEVRELNLNTFRLALKDLEFSEDGIDYPKTHNHNTTVLLSGITYARVIEIINGYTVTFEDGQYAVNLVGANSNVGDVTNVNQVSVRVQNSAGLIEVNTVTNGNSSSSSEIANTVWNHSSANTLSSNITNISNVIPNLPSSVANTVWLHSTANTINNVLISINTSHANTANDVWNHSSATMMINKLVETWGRLGLDLTKPLHTGTASISFGDIVMAMTESNGTVTVTRVQ